LQSDGYRAYDHIGSQTYRITSLGPNNAFFITTLKAVDTPASVALPIIVGQPLASSTDSALTKIRAVLPLDHQDRIERNKSFTIA